MQILWLIETGHNPSLIAKKLGMSDQNMHYHTEKLRKAGLITKQNDGNGILWMLTQTGRFLLSESFTGSVNGSKGVHGRIPVRIHNVSYKFNIDWMPEIPDLEWRTMNNGVAKCNVPLRFTEDTAEFVRSLNKGKSLLLVHLAPRYFMDPNEGLVGLSMRALNIRDDLASKYRLEIDTTPRLGKKPHYAFEKDFLALYLACSSNASVSTNAVEGNEAWIDSSMGKGEFETNDPHYLYLYLEMPKTVYEIRQELDRIRKQTSGYERHHDPLLTYNN